MRLVVQRQVRADLLPALAAVRRPVDVLAARVDRVVIVRRDGDRKRPVEAILHVAGRRADGDLRPDLDFAHLPRALVEALDGAAEAAEPGAGRPDDVVVDRIGNRQAALAARRPNATGRAESGCASASSACFAMRLLLGPRVEGPSCRLP